MTLTKEEIKVLRKQYPAEAFDLVEKKGQVVIKKRTTVLRVPESIIKLPGDAAAAAETLEKTFYALRPGPKDFKQIQIKVSREFAQALSLEAKKCGTRKITYLFKLIGDAIEAKK